MTNPQNMSFLEHFSELRKRLTRSVLVIIAAFLVCYEFHVEIFDFVSRPIQEGLISHGIYRFRSLSVTEPIMVYLKVSLVAAIIIGSPYLIFQMWLFISPGLHSRERRAIVPIVFFSTFFFLLGVAFCYTVLLPFLTEFLVGIGEETAAVAVDVTLQSALSYALVFLIIFGLVFQLPLVLFFMTVLGVVTPHKLMRFYRYWLVISFFLAAILTPPDPISQLMMAVPLVVLYGVGVLASFFAFAWKKKNEDLEEKNVLSRMWSISGFVLLAGMLVLIVQAMLPAGRSHPLRWLDTQRSMIIGFQPAVLVRDGVWSSTRAELVSTVPELSRLLSNEKRLPELILVASDLRGIPTVIVSGKGVHEHVKTHLALGLEERTEGPALVYGTTGSMRSGVGLLIACVDDRCAFGPANDLMESLRRYRSGLVDEAQQSSLDELRRRGPVWGRFSASSVPLVEERWGIRFPEEAQSVKLWMVPSEEAPFLHVAFEPRDSELMDALFASVDALTSLGKNASPPINSAVVLQPTQALELYLKDAQFQLQQGRLKNGSADLLPKRKEFQQIDYQALVGERGNASPPDQPSSSLPNSARQVMGYDLMKTRIWKRDGYIEGQWRSTTIVRKKNEENRK